MPRNVSGESTGAFWALRATPKPAARQQTNSNGHFLVTEGISGTNLKALRLDGTWLGAQPALPLR
jgi:hypothetical protein